jgi:hypothetical protein
MAAMTFDTKDKIALLDIAVSSLKLRYPNDSTKDKEVLAAELRKLAELVAEFDDITRLHN